MAYGDNLGGSGGWDGDNYDFRDKNDRMGQPALAAGPIKVMDTAGAFPRQPVSGAVIPPQAQTDQNLPPQIGANPVSGPVGGAAYGPIGDMPMPPGGSNYGPLALRGIADQRTAFGMRNYLNQAGIGQEGYLAARGLAHQESDIRNTMAEDRNAAMSPDRREEIYRRSGATVNDAIQRNLEGYVAQGPPINGPIYDDIAGRNAMRNSGDENALSILRQRPLSIQNGLSRDAIVNQQGREPINDGQDITTAGQQLYERDRAAYEARHARDTDALMRARNAANAYPEDVPAYRAPAEGSPLAASVAAGRYDLARGAIEGRAVAQIRAARTGQAITDAQAGLEGSRAGLEEARYRTAISTAMTNPEAINSLRDSLVASVKTKADREVLQNNIAARSAKIESDVETKNLALKAVQSDPEFAKAADALAQLGPSMVGRPIIDTPDNRANAARLNSNIKTIIAKITDPTLDPGTREALKNIVADKLHTAGIEAGAWAHKGEWIGALLDDASPFGIFNYAGGRTTGQMNAIQKPITDSYAALLAAIGQSK